MANSLRSPSQIHANSLFSNNKEDDQSSLSKSPQSILQILESIRPLLPNQAPLSNYIHNNILEFFEIYPYWDGIKEARKYYENNLAMPLKYYVDAFEKKRISNSDLKRTLERHHYLFPILDARHLWSALFVRLLPKTVATYRHSYLEQILINLDFDFPKIRDPNSERDRGELVSLIIQLLAPLIDQGMGHWNDHHLFQGIWNHAHSFFANHPLLPAWCCHLNGGLDHFKEGKSFEDIIVHCLKQRKIQPENYYEYISARLFELKGWSGLVFKLESSPHLAPILTPQLNSMEYVALYLILENEFLNYYPDNELIYVDPRKQLNFYLSSLFTHRHWKDEDREEIKQWAKFYFFERKRIWHEAFELHLRRDFCQNFLYEKTLKYSDRPKADVYAAFCIDDREESIRRHLEIIDNKTKTFGVAGFYGVDIKFMAGFHESFVHHCPAPLVSQHLLRENVVNKNKKNIEQQKPSLLGLIYSAVKGQFVSYLYALWGVVPLVFKVYAPRLWALIQENWNKKETQIEIKYLGETFQGLKVGYTVEEMAERVAQNLKLASMDIDLPELVIIFGHNSSNVNNPYKNAYGCGACSGRNGGINARVFCQMVNDQEVRTILAEKYSLKISEQTYFLAALHDTSTDVATYYDLELLPTHLKSRFEKFRNNMDQALKENALERCRRFHSIDITDDKDLALNYVYERANSMAEPRPEYGHTSNAFCIIGRRELTQNIFLDRRAFLVSYDPETDLDGTKLLALLGISVPVCAGINLDYTLSKIDNENLGAGTKLPLNIVGIVGVMTGASSDLRTCLPRQMVEWHEPTRMTFLIETTPEKALQTIAKHPRVSRILLNEWSRLLVYDSKKKEMWFLYDKEFKKIELNRKKIKITDNMWSILKDRKDESPFFILSELRNKMKGDSND